MRNTLKQVLIFFVFCSAATISMATLAQNKVVVIPLGADAAVNTGQNQGDVVGYVVVIGTTLNASWMASGETPSITVTGTGIININWPGENFPITGSSAMSAQATLYSAAPYFIALDSNGANTVVWTWNSSGTLAHPFGFTVTLFQNSD